MTFGTSHRISIAAGSCQRRWFGMHTFTPKPTKGDSGPTKKNMVVPNLDKGSGDSLILSMSVEEFRDRWKEDVACFTAEDWLDWLAPNCKQRILSRQQLVQEHMNNLEKKSRARHDTLHGAITASDLESFCGRVGIVLAPEIGVRPRSSGRAHASLRERRSVFPRGSLEMDSASGGYALSANHFVRAGSIVCSIPQYVMIDSRDRFRLLSELTTPSSRDVVHENIMKHGTTAPGSMNEATSVHCKENPTFEPNLSQRRKREAVDDLFPAGTQENKHASSEFNDGIMTDNELDMYLFGLEYLVAQMTWHSENETSPLHDYARYVLQAEESELRTPCNLPYLTKLGANDKRNNQQGNCSEDSSILHNLNLLMSKCHKQIMNPLLTSYQRSGASMHISARRRAFAQVLSRQFHIRNENSADIHSVLIPIADLMNHDEVHFNAGGLLLRGASSYNTMNEIPTNGTASTSVTLEHVLINFLAGVSLEAVEEPHYHIITLKDVSPGEELTTIYSDMDPSTPLGQNVWTAIWGFLPQRMSSLNANQWDQLIRTTFALLLRTVN